MRILQILTLTTILLIGMKATAQTNEEKQTQKFNVIDADGNEVITIREMIAFHKGKTNKQGEPFDAKVMFYGLDINKNSIITLNEFLKGIDWKEGKKRVEDDIRKRTPDYVKSSPIEDINAKKREDKFYSVDDNNDGVVSLLEMINFHKGRKNKKGNPVESELMFYGLDRNDDNKLTLEEFIQKVDWQGARFKMREVESNTPTLISQDITSKNDKFIIIDANIDNALSLQELIDFNNDKTSKSGEPINGAIIFYGLDSNEDGRVSPAEFNQKINWKLGKQKLKQSNKSIASNKVFQSNKVAQSNKVVTSYHVPTPSDDYVNEQIAKFYDVDVDKNYKLTLEELINYYIGKTNKKGKPINGEVMYYGLDTNDDGSIELEEFTKKVNLIKAMRKINSKRG